MTTTGFVGLLLLVGSVWYWLSAMRAKDIARQAGRRRCKEVGVMLLDDTVVQRKLRLRRDPEGRLSFYREYRFEFTGDGNTRHRGELALHGERIVRLEMEPYRF